MSDDDKATWLPNLVRGVSIWKLARDLNEPKFMDGRLLEPETEGSDSLPVRVHWHLERLVPLPEAREKHPEAAEQAVREFFACLDRVSKELADASSGYHDYKEAFSVPALEADGGKNYFFDPATKKLLVINWGASPRTLAGQGEMVFGYDTFDRMFKKAGLERGALAAGLAASAAASSEASPAAGAAPAPNAPADEGGAGAPQGEAPTDEKKEEQKDEEKKDEDEGKPIWFWILLGIAILALVGLLAWLLRGCDETGADGADAGAGGAAADAGADAGADAAADDGGLDAGEDGAIPSDLDDGGAGGADAGADAAGDAGDDDAGSDAGDGGDGGAAEGEGEGEGEGAEGEGGGGEGEGGGAEGPSPVVVVIGGPASGGGSGSIGGVQRPQTGIPFRAHFHPDAKAWRVKKGKSHLHPTLKPAVRDGAFEVFLKPGSGFHQIEVEWRDATGKWHPH